MYKAIRLPNINPLYGFSDLINPENPLASPAGWHSDGLKNWTTTQGNNADVFVGSLRGYRPDGGSQLKFDSNWKANEDPLSPNNRQASSVHLFTLVNIMHDLAYHYGFTEKAGNFQQNNFGRGECKDCDLDRVLVNNLNPRGINNANFGTPPDGQSPRMNMYVFEVTQPYRDGSLDSIIPIHEFVHGISNRLTGGRRDSRCLNYLESGGMGEGWSDAIGMFLARTSNDNRYKDVSVGWYILGDDPSGGIRHYPYSTRTKTNPLKLESLLQMNEVHDVGEVWAVMLNEVFWNLGKTQYLIF